MIIIEQPTFEICKCAVCGTVFQPQTGDDIDYQVLTNGEVYRLMVRCPTCRRYCKVTVNEKTRRINDERKSKLKPCPFCGGEAEAVVDDETETLSIIQCTECKAQTAGHDFLSSAKYAWNRRARNDDRAVN